jgi:hypothetical protein
MADMIDPHIQAAEQATWITEDCDECQWDSGPYRSRACPKHGDGLKAVRAWLASVGMSSENLAHADEACALYFAGTWRDRMVRPWADAVRAVEQA